MIEVNPSEDNLRVAANQAQDEPDAAIFDRARKLGSYLTPSGKWRKLGAITMSAMAFAGAEAGTANAYRTYPQMDRIASWIAMRPVTARCFSAEETKKDGNLDGGSGYTPWLGESAIPYHPADYTELPPVTCDPIIKYLKNEKAFNSYPTPLQTTQEINDVYNLGSSVLALTHESFHLRKTPWGYKEGKVECEAIRHVPYVIEAMGMKPALAKKVYRSALEDHEWIASSGGFLANYSWPNCDIKPRAEIYARFNKQLHPTVTRYKRSHR